MRSKATGSPGAAVDRSESRRRRLRRLLLTGAAAVLAGGCVTTPSEFIHNGFKVGPNYQRPPAPVAESWIDAANPKIHSEPVDLSAWWTVFRDPALDCLVHTAYQQNLDLRSAGARILQARAQRGIAVGSLFPQAQQLHGSYTRNMLSENAANQGGIPERYFSEWELGPSMSWELDFWGRYRRAVESADANLNATIEGYDHALVLLLAEVAAVYAQMRNVQTQIAYLRENVKIQQGSLDIAEARYKSGAVTEMDVTQAKANLYQTESQIPPREAALRVANNILCTLLGIPPRDLTLELGSGEIPVAPPEVCVGIPAELLRRRPDVRRAERELASQSARIGIAESDLYPRFMLSGTIEFEAQDFGSLFEGKSVAASVGPSFAWNILNYGRILNNVRLQDARFEELAATYQNTVLRANREAEDGIINYLKAQEQAQDLAIAVQNAQRSVELALVQYRQGQIDFNQVFFLENFLVQQQLELAQARFNIALGLIRTYEALGGGWEIRLCDAPAGSLVADEPTLHMPQALPPAQPVRDGVVLP